MMIDIIKPIHVTKLSSIREVNQKKKKGIFELEKAKKHSKQILNKEEFGIDTLYFIQDQEDDKYKNKDYNYAKAVLQLLSKYRKSVILGRASLKELQEMKGILNFSKPNISNDKMASIIQEIDILAKVELAKKGMI